MAVLLMIYRKMVRNKWLIMSLLVGYILFIALMCSIPLYTNGIMQNMLRRELEGFQTERNLYTGSTRVFSDYDYYKGGWDVRQWLFNDVSKYIDESFIEDSGIPAREQVVYHGTRFWRVLEDNRERDVPASNLSFKFAYLTDFEDNIRIREGEMPSTEVQNGVHEVVITEMMMFQHHITIGDEFLITNNRTREELGELRIRIVGVFEPNNENPLYWFDDVSRYRSSIFLSSAVFESVFLEDFYIDETTWFTAMDYHRINVHNVHDVYAAYRGLEAWIRDKGFSSFLPAMDLLPRFDAQRERLTPLLLSLYAPIIIMLLFYLFMVSSLVVEKQRNEIAVLISRGAGRAQLIFSYLLEAIILGAIGMVAGPFLGVLLTRILGSTTNFLEFVNRTAMQIDINAQTYGFAVGGMLLSIIATILPVYFATGVNILEHKRNVSRRSKPVFWKRYFLDVALVGVAFYGYYQFDQRQQDLLETSADFLSIDPLLFIVSALFTLGFGLLFIRIFPYLIEGIYRIGRRFWSLTMYTSLIQVARSAHSYQFLMLFIVMTISTGLFSATAARTINQNAQDKIRYHNGADHILMAQWSVEGVFAPVPVEGAAMPPGQSMPEQETGSVHYEEPPFGVYPELAGVAGTAKVFDTEARIYAGGGTHVVRLKGIEPRDFGETAWFPDGLTPYHWYHDLNQLARNQSMVLISRSVSNRLGLSLWDTFTMNWSPNGMAEFMVAGIIDYWPTWNPNVPSDRDNGIYDMLVVGHLNYIYDNSIIQPYEVWLQMEPGATTEALYEDIREKNLRILRISDTEKELVDLSRDPIHLGINGALTLVFLISVVIILSGFILFWILAIYARMFQSGIMMAMGMKLRELVVMMTWEQILTSILPMLYGVVVGGLASALFVPMLQMSFSASEQVPPFRVIALAGDYLKIYSILGIMVMVGLAIIGYMLSRLQIYSCIKLGEDG